MASTIQNSFCAFIFFPLFEVISRKFWTDCFSFNKMWKSTTVHNDEILESYSVSTLETTIFRQISLIFRRTFLCSWFTLNFVTLMGGNRGSVLPPIRVSKCGVYQELRKKNLKLTLTNKII